MIRKRFSEEAIDQLLEIAWWYWDMEKITRNLDLIVTTDLEALKTCR